MEKSKFVDPKIDMVFKTMWLKGNNHVRKYLERMVEYSIGRKLESYELGHNEAGKLTLKSVANKYDILLISNNPRSRLNVEMNRTLYLTSNKNDTYLGHLLANFYQGVEERNRYKEEISVEQVNFNCYREPHDKLIHRLDFEFVDLNYKMTKRGVKSHQLNYQN